MRLKKGMKVEVLNTKEDSVGIWLSAEIISCNGRSYNVKYCTNLGSRVEKVRRQVIRPCPPSVQGIDEWVSGDLVEVYQNKSWRAAMIVGVDGSNNYTARLLGRAEELVCHKLQIRVRQVWQDGKWFVPGKRTQSYTPDKKRMTGARESGDIPLPCVLSKRTAKRKPDFTSSGVEEHHIRPQKRRLVVETTLGDGRIRSENPSLSFGRWGGRKKEVGDNNLNSSSRIERSSILNADAGGCSGSHQLRMSKSTVEDSCASSVGSCSFDNHDLPYRFTTHHNAEDADESSDAESSCANKDNEKASLRHGKEISQERRSHSSEFQTYTRAIQSLYASGPFSWEEETKMSNLRRSLNISDDEHLNLMMIPKLIPWPFSEVFCLFSKTSRLWEWILKFLQLSGRLRIASARFLYWHSICFHIYFKQCMRYHLPFTRKDIRRSPLAFALIEIVIF